MVQPCRVPPGASMGPLPPTARLAALFVLTVLAVTPAVTVVAQPALKQNCLGGLLSFELTEAPTAAVTVELAASFAGTSVRATVVVDPTGASCSPATLNLKASNVNLKSAVSTLWSSAPQVVTNALDGVTFANVVSRSLQDILYVSASSDSVSFRAGLDKDGLRLLEVGLPGTLSFGSILSELGVTGGTSLSDTLTVTGTRVLYVPGNGTGVVDEDGSRRSPGLSLNSNVAVPALNIPASAVSMLVSGADGAVRPEVRLQWASTITPIRFVTLSQVTLSIPQGQGSPAWQAVGSLADIPVDVQFSVPRNITARLPITLSAKNVNLTAAARTMWADAPSVVINALRAVSFGSLVSRMPDDILYVSASSDSVSFRAGLDKDGRRLSGSIAVSPKPLSITAASLRVEGRILTTSIATQLVYEAKRGVFGLQVAIDSFSLQESLAALGINVNLGQFNVAIRNARISYATVDINEQLRQGLAVSGSISVRGLTANVAFKMDTNGFRLATTVDFSVLMDSFYSGIETVLSKIGINLKALNINLRDAFRLEMLSIDLTVTRTQQAFRGSLRMVMLGRTVTLTVSIDITDIVKSLLEVAFKEVTQFFTGACTRESYDRGVGRIPTGCADDRELFSGLCYRKCWQNWQYGVYGRDNRCYQNCPPGYRDDDPVGKRGLSCSKLECDPGYRYDGALMCMENCRPGWSSDGALLCYENCPAGWSYVMLNCQRWACNDDEDDNGAGLCYQKCAHGYESDGAALCRGPCPDGYAWHWLTCFRGYKATRGKGCCCTIFGCCGCSRVRGQMDGNHGDWYDAGCFCARNAHTIGRSTYWRGSRTKLTSYTRASYFTKTVGAVKSFWRNIEDRGVGLIPTRCVDPEFPSYEGGLCYRQCAPGYDSAVTMCIRQCPQDYVNCGTFCVPRGIPLGCAAFIGATFQNCGSRYQRRGVLSIAREVAQQVASGNSTQPGGAINTASVSGTGRVARELPPLNSTLDGNSTKPGCQTSLDCFCKGVKSGLRFPNPFSASPGFIVCHAGGAIVTDCGPGAIYNTTLGSCVLSLEAANGDDVNPCLGASDGVYARRNSTGGYEAYECKGGELEVMVKAADARPSNAVAQAVPKGGKMGSPVTTAIATASACKQLSCFCQGKPDGVYLDTLAPGLTALKGYGNRTLSTGELDTMFINRVAGAYRSFIRCTGGIATRRSCPAGATFYAPTKRCSRYQAVAAPANATSLSVAPLSMGRGQLPGGI